ncbi:hypothetical protein PAXRUDRAFT_636619 [Paxillus rubicundulus Ve08.2h10]|uniref:Uncharacterized protein n=1 Tax=Paxillus rubicundulus Ve08.2h10 TaxID=930991 RepID=A0A0D0EC57_9AGAM|nr:hypothetical protein PAXRUDRAFT_636619 [Paxillus rubicundulus Ve08.2h10]
MFHFSTERLAGLDNMILKITAPSKLPTIISHHTLDHDPYIKVKKVKKSKPQRASRPPLADKTSSNNVALNLPPTETVITPMLLNVSCCPTSEVKALAAKDATPPRVGRSPADTDSFRPLPPLPSASTLQLPSFLNFSTQSLTPPVEPQLRRSTSSLPASVLFRVSSTPVSSPRRVVIRKTKKKVYEGPHWIPAFHHPNSPYVPWTSAARQRILPPPSPPPASPVRLPPFFSRNGAVAPEPWTSDASLKIPKKSTKERLSTSWKSFKDSVKNGVRNVVAHLEKSRKTLKKSSNSQDILRTRHGIDTITTVKFDMFSTANPSLPPRLESSCSRYSLASFASSDSKTLSTWLAERRTTAPEAADDSAGEMSVEEYELTGSWLDLRHNDGEWVCGVKDCDLHTSDGSPNVMCEHPKAFRTAMPFDSADLLMAPIRPREPSLSFSSGILAPPQFSSLPRLPSQSFNIVSACKGKPGVYPNAERCLTSKKSRELSMPGGWTFS